jgi:3-hydroxy-3-methylglutaryl CoA synthase
LQFSYGSGKTARKFLAVGCENITKISCLLGKSSLECYKSLKEGFETHAPSYETVHPWVNNIKNGSEEEDNASRSTALTMAMDEHHME